MVEINAQTLGDLPQNIAAAFQVVDGKVMLDETLLKTKADVDAVLEGKRKEVNDHNSTKAVLEKWKALGYDTPDAVADLIADLQNRSGNSSELTEKLAALQREKRDILKERDGYKAELDGIKPIFEEQKKAITTNKINELIVGEVSKLKGIDAERLNLTLKRDVALGLIGLDESGEALTVKTGTDFAKYAMEQADLFGFKLANNPGGSNPGNDKLPRNIPNPPQNNFPGEIDFLGDELRERLSN